MARKIIKNKKIGITKNSNLYKHVEALKSELESNKRFWGCKKISILLNDSTATTASTDKLLLTISDETN